MNQLPELQNLPKLTVIGGDNGSGKTRYLEHLRGAHHDGTRDGDFRRLLYIPSDYQMTSFGRGREPMNFTPKLIRDRIYTYIKTGEYNDPNFNSIADDVLKRIIPNFKGIKNVDAATIRDIDREAIFDNIPIDISWLIKYETPDEELVAEVFENYHGRITRRKARLYDAGHGHEGTSRETDLGQLPPWDDFNSLLERYGFRYRITAPVYDEHYTPRFIDLDSAREIEFSALSTGEKLILRLVLWAYNKHRSFNYKAFLLDEFDAHLNPRLSRVMMEVIAEVIVGRYGIQVIMTTHSPTTVAFSPPEALMWMDRAKGLTPISKREAVSRLSQGLITLQDEDVPGIVRLAMAADELAIVFCEGKTDRQILQIAWKKLHADEPIPFHLVDYFDCFAIVNVVAREDILQRYRNNLFGVLDYDDAISHARDRLRPPKWQPKVDDGTGIVSFVHTSRRAIVMSLPVPQWRDQYASVRFTRSRLSIELLFPDEVVGPYCEIEEVPGGGRLLRMNDRKKASFADAVEHIDAANFAGFRPLFEFLTNADAEMR